MFDSLWKQDNFFLLRNVQTCSDNSTQPPINYYQLSIPEVKQPGREADHFLPHSVNFKNAWRHTSTPAHIFMSWYVMIPHVFTLNITLSFLLHLRLLNVSPSSPPPYCSLSSYSPFISSSPHKCGLQQEQTKQQTDVY